MHPAARFSVLAAAILLSACAASPDWTKPDATERQVASDWSACQRFARERSGSIVHDDFAVGTSGAAPGPRSAFDPYDRKKAAGRYDAYLAACMDAKGYTPARRAP